MRNISFAMTTRQILDQSKTVTRRIGWDGLQPGTLLQPVEKGQGLKKGERARKLGGPILVRSASRELLVEGVSQSDVRREGFPQMSPREFIEMFCQHNRCTPTTNITRIEFSYTEPK